MSLDIRLTDAAVTRMKPVGIFIREAGSTRSITPEEWAQRFPDKVPVMFLPEDEEPYDHCVYEANITHNLIGMAKASWVV